MVFISFEPDSSCPARPPPAAGDQPLSNPTSAAAHDPGCRCRELHAPRARRPLTSVTRSPPTRPLRLEILVFDIALWLAQGLLALFFLAAGLPKVIGRGIDRWVGFEDVPRMLTIVIGVSEVAGAAALALPPLLGAFEWITPLASIGIAVVSLMAGGFH